MTFLPVVERELRVAARRRGTYWSRFGAAAIGAALAAWILLAVEDSAKNIGADLFAVVSTVIFLYAAVAGTMATCDCLSEEKREGTLGLLFLTDLKGRDVVLGKLASTSVNVFYGMLAVMPMLAIPFLLGGVSWAEMLRVVLVSLNLLFLFLSIGLFASAVCHKDNWARGMAIAIGVGLVGIGLAFACFASSPYRDTVGLSSPAASCCLAFDTGYNQNPHAEFWSNVAITHLYGWFFFMLACGIVPRSWQDRPVKKPWRWITAPGQSAGSRTELLEINPFLWRVARSGRKRLMVWLTLGILTALWWWYVPDHWDAGVDLFLLVPAGLILKMWIAGEASRTLSEDRRSGGLELLLSTPLHERDIVRGQLLALKRQFGLPVAAVLLACLLFVIAGSRRWGGGEVLDRASWLWMHLIFGGLLVADIIALGWDATWLGLIHRKPNRAALAALARIVVAPVVIFIILMTAFGSQIEQLNAVLIVWIVLGLGADLWFGLAARAKLLAQFRTIASEGVARNRPAKETP